MARKRGAKDAYDKKPDSSANEPSPEPEPEQPKPSTSRGGKLSDKQKEDLKKHMDKVGKDMSVSERKSHRMKMMQKMRQGSSVAKAHKEITA